MDLSFTVGATGAGTSSNPCSERHSGPAAFSELEAENVRTMLLHLNNSAGGIYTFISLHEHGQTVTVPWTALDMVKTEDYEYLVSPLTNFYNRLQNNIGSTKHS